MQETELKPIFGKMATADFYPEDADGEYIEITITAPIDTVIYVGEVALLTKRHYTALQEQVRVLREVIEPQLELATTGKAEVKVNDNVVGSIEEKEFVEYHFESVTGG